MEASNATNSRFALPRRVATEPAPFQPPRRSLSVSSTTSRTSLLGPSKQADESIETLYNHPSVKIIAFTSSQRTTSGGSDFLAEPKPGSLTPSSHLERTIAIGPFRIYRAPGSVAFLSCGSALQPILPKSQCWCIDEANSRFILQIRRPQYWRIEVPLSDAEDVHRALVLKEVFDSILLFEKTECPFERSFTIALPERPQTPIKKKPWTSVGKKLIKSPFLTDLSPAFPASELVSKKRRSKTLTSGIERQVEQQIAEGNTSNVPLPVTTDRIGVAHSLPGHEEDTTVGEDGERIGQGGGLVGLLEEAPDADNVLSHTTLQVQQNLPVASKVTTIPEIHKEPDTPVGNEAALEQVLSEAVSNCEGDATLVDDSESTSSATNPVMEMQEEVKTVEEPKDAEQAQKIVSENVKAVASSLVLERPTTHSEKEIRPDTPVTQGSRLTSTTKVKSPTRVSTTSCRPQEALIAPLNLPASSDHSTSTSQSESSSEKDANLQSTAVEPNSVTAGISPRLVALNRVQQDNAQTPSTSIVGGENTSAKVETSKSQGADEPHSFEGAGSIGAISLKKKRMSRILAGRSVTLPPQLTLVTSPPTSTTPRPTPEPLLMTASRSTHDLGGPPVEEVVEEASPIESVDSFHSVQSWHSPVTPLPPSPPSSSASPAMFPYPHENIIIPAKGLRTTRSANFTPSTDDTFVPSSAGLTIHALASDSPASSTLHHENGNSQDADFLHLIGATTRSTALPERPGLQHRSRTTNLSISRHALSPLPSAANLFSPVRQRPVDRLAAVRNLPGAIINKTVEILLSPPGHLVNLMLKVAAKIAAGEWRGLVFGMGEGGESIPVHWDYSDGELSSWEDDDDYKFSIGRLAKTRSNSSNASQGEVDPSPAPPGAKDENDRGWEVD